MTPTNRELPRTTIAVVTILFLLISSLFIVQPLLGAVIWATMIVVATWPVLISLQRRLWGKRALAVTGMTLALFLLFAVPIGMAVGSVAGRLGELESGQLNNISVPPPPAWVQKVPMVGTKIDTAWREVATGQVDLATKVQPYLQPMIAWLGRKAGSFLALVVQLIVIVIAAAILYANGEIAAYGVRRFAERLAGERGDRVIVLAGQAIRGVAFGVVVTAILQTALSGLGLWLFGIPQAAFLTAVIFLLCVAQVGPALVMIPAVFWMYSTGQTGKATLFLLWTLVCITMDNILRPILIKRGADLPLPLVFLGVIGGLIGFGLIGIFVGPVVLAVTYTLLVWWVTEDPEHTSPAKEPAATPGVT
ncbi:MAG TPA: AI-2E family transporter YdiK [Gemmatimonadales bacterium]|nr:AI-2E family transporter YdiK [Gemmatimonadales bacterium]